MNDVYEFKCREASRRIIELRTQAGMTQEQLAEKLGVSSQTIKNYEKAGSGNVRGTESDTRSNAIAGMKIETLFVMAKLFNVSADYLLCISDAESQDPNMKNAVEFTGLSQDAIAEIVRFRDGWYGEKAMPILNWLLSHNEKMNKIILDLDILELANNEYCTARIENDKITGTSEAELEAKLKALPDDEQEDLFSKMYKTGHSVLDAQEKCEVAMYRASKAFNGLLDKFLSDFCNPVGSREMIDWDYEEDE